MSIAKGLQLLDVHAVEYVDRGSKLFADKKMRHSYGALALTLSSVLNEVNAPLRFDLLSLDVKGNEPSVLNVLDLIKYKPK